MTLLLLLACESDYEREQREWREGFGPIADLYSVQPATVQLDPSQVQGRKVLVDRWYADEPRERWEALTPGEVGLGANTDLAGVQAYEALAKPYLERLQEDTAHDLPELQGRKVLLIVRDREWKVSQNGVTEERRASGAEEVGLVLVEWREVDEEPSHTYAGGEKGYAGKGFVVAFAHPEGVPVGRGELSCELPDQKLVELLPGMRERWECRTSSQERDAFVAGL